MPRVCAVDCDPPVGQTFLITDPDTRFTMMIAPPWRNLPVALLAVAALVACGDDGGGGGGDGDACDGVTCNTPPAAECSDGVTLRIYETNGNCIGGECEYGIRTIACDQQGGSCGTEGGVAQCVGTDACFGVTCDSPPTPTCEGAIAVVYSDSGTCSGGFCDYTEDRTDCAALDQVCSGGLCVSDVDPCLGVVCDSPPGDFCNADGERVAYESRGSCNSGVCSYTETTGACPDGEVCFDGDCLADPCDGVTCDTPPAPTCNDAGEVVTYADTGACAPDDADPTVAACSYDESAEACEGDLLCFDGECVEDTGACTDVTCDDPPPADCNEDGQVLTYDAGECNPETGDCLYVPTASDCDEGLVCMDGECAEFVDLCIDVVCEDAPVPTCNPDGDLVTFAEGVCNPLTGECDYAETAEACPDGFECAGTTCAEIPDPCEDVVCEDDPDSFCNEDGDAVTYAEGICSATDDGTAECTYAETITDCTDTEFCSEAECIPAPSEGDLVITEYLNNADGEDDDREWFEVLNTTDGPLYIGGLIVRDLDDVEQDVFTVDADIIIEAGAYFVFAETETSTDAVGFAWNPVAPDWTLSNGSDEIELAIPGADGGDEVIIDTVQYDDDAGWPDASGRSVSLDPSFLTATDNDSADNWCFGTDTYLDLFVDLGSPGLANEACDFACFDVFCPQPENTCVDDDTVLEYSGDGVCNPDDSSCDFSAVSAEVDCEVGFICAEGTCIDTSVLLEAGDLVITEFLNNPIGSEDVNEWIEVLNVSGGNIQTGGLRFADAGSDSLVIETDITVADGEYFVVVESADAFETAPTNLVIGTGSHALANGDDEIIIFSGDTEIDRVEYDDAVPAWGDPDGASRSLDGAADAATVDNNDPNNWCVGVGEYRSPAGDVNAGTPGAANGVCPP